MKSKEMTIPELFIVTLVPSAIFVGLYISLGMVWQGVPSIALFFILASFTLFLYETVVVLLANKNEHGKYGFQIAFSKCKKMDWWIPFNNIFRIFAFGVAAVIAYKKENIYITIVFHCLCNLFTCISFIAAILT